jgi:hypothetical protein
MNTHPPDPPAPQPLDSALASQPPSPAPLRGGPPAGLCDTCAFQRKVPNTRGSTFSLCNRSREDPAYPRYPRLPVNVCAGYERRGREE